MYIGMQGCILAQFFDVSISFADSVFDSVFLIQFLLQPISCNKLVYFCMLSPAHTVRFWPRFGHLRQIWKILKDSYNPRLKSAVFDRWFDMFTDSRLMAVAIKFQLWRNSGSVRRFGAQSCNVTTLRWMSNCLRFSRQAMSWMNARELFYQP